MSARILDGKVLAAQLKEQLKVQVQQLKEMPKLYAINFLQDPAIESYALSQQKTAASLGIDYKRFQAPACKSEDDAVQYLQSILRLDSCAGIFIFTPTPQHLDFNVINSRLMNTRNVEGVYPFNLGFLFLGLNSLVPPTAAAVLELIKFANVVLEGKSAVIVGRSNIIGKPLMHLLLQENLTVSVCHSKTPTNQLIALIKSADVVVASVGKVGFIKKDWIKPGAIVIDVGTSEVNGQIKGDVADDVKEVAGYLSLVPGGVGPVTTVMLMKNALEAFKQSL